MTRPLLLVEPEAVTAPGDLLRCEPYAATVSARTCLLRRAALKRKRRVGEGGPMFVRCGACPVGEGIEARLGVAEPAAPSTGFRFGRSPRKRSHEEQELVDRAIDEVFEVDADILKELAKR